MSKKILMLLVAALATAWMAGAASALTNDAFTKGLWHMDAIVVTDANYVLDDDDGGGRDNDVLLNNALLVAPGYDGGGKCMHVDPNGEGSGSGYPSTVGLWNYEWQTFKFEGQIASDDRISNLFLFATYDQVGVTQQDADTDGVGEIVFYVKTWKDGIADPCHLDDANNQETNTIYAEMIDSNDWQSVECSYDLDEDGNGVMTIVTDVETVVVAKGIGPIAPHITRIWTYIANRKSGANLFQGKMDEVKISVFPPYITPAASDPKFDDFETWALWHMDETEEVVVSGNTFDQIPDDDPTYPVRNHDLLMNPWDYLGSPRPASNPQLLTPGYDGTGKCLQFDPLTQDQSNDVSTDNWAFDRGTFKFEGWLSLDGGSCYVLMIYDVVQLYKIGEEFRFGVMTYDDGVSGTYHATTAYADAVPPAAWQHLEAEYSLDACDVGTITLISDLETEVISDGNQIGPVAYNPGRPYFYFGHAKHKGWTHYKGRMDEVKISRPYPEGGEPCYVQPPKVQFQDDPFTYALWHFDESYISDPCSGAVGYPDDDSANPGRNHDVVEWGGAAERWTELGSPGFDGNDTGVSVRDTGGEINYILLAGNWPEDWKTVKYQGWVRFDANSTGGYIFHIYDCVRLIANGSDSVTFTVQDSVYMMGEDANIVSVNAALRPTSEWQYIEAAYDLDTIRITTEMETVSDAGIGDWVINPATRAIYIACRKNQNRYVGWLDETKISIIRDALCGDWGYYAGDFDLDCHVDEDDLVTLSDNWLASSDPTASGTPEYGPGQPGYAAYNIPRAPSVTATMITGIDGAISVGEYAGAKVVEIVYPDNVTAPQVGSIKYDEPDSPADLSARYYYCWDDDYLYSAIRVWDENFTGGPYPEDHATVQVNIGNDGNTPFLETAFYELSFKDSNAVVNYYWSGSFPAFDPDNAVVAANVAPGGWVFEAAWKWDDFNSYSPTLNDVHGMGSFILDKVDDDETVTFLWSYGAGDTQAATKPNLWQAVTLVNALACGENGYLVTDLDTDCTTNISDFALMAENWMKCTDPTASGIGCDNLNQ